MSDPWCPNGWTPPPQVGSAYKVPIAPPDSGCTGLPCVLSVSSRYVVGSTWLFDVVADPFETRDVAAENPDVVETLLARLQSFNASNVTAQRGTHDPLSDPAKFGGVWTPWRGNPDPAACDTNKTNPHP